MTAPRLKITYATLRADNEELHALYEAGLAKAKGRLGAYHRNFVDGRERDGDGSFEVRSPIDTDILVGTFAKGTRKDVGDAIAAARRAQPAWFRLGWEQRLEILKGAAELISERQMEYGGLMAIEVGKTRIEALGEVEEAADLIRYYARTAEDNAFYDHPMDNLGDAAVHTRSILRPHGVFAVISPFNFPMALAVGPTCAAMMAGNTVILKPASASAMTAIAILEAYRDAGVPDGVFNLVMGPGSTVGAELQENQGIDGIVFTGSYEVGFDIFRNFSKRYPRPCIVEMGGKNPAIVLKSADLEEAAEGVMRASFGFGGQKCSANSRVYVEPTVVGLPADHHLFQDELFAPFVAVAAVDSLDEALTLANDNLYGLTAGVYSEDPAEVQQFLEEVHAGVLYVNRRAGATTGAWPGVQAFGGWKGSGSTGKSGLSMYYVAQFLREQSHTVVD